MFYTLKPFVVSCVVLGSLFLASCSKDTEKIIEDKKSTSLAKYYDAKTATTYVLNPNRHVLGMNEGSKTTGILGTITDASGQVEIRVWEATSDVVPHPQVAVNVDPGYVVVGGGARVLASNGVSVPEGLLTEARPANDGTFSTWLASSKDHGISYAHKLQAYVIGMRISGIDAYTLRQYMSLSENTSGYFAHPNTAVSVPAGYRLVGGGAKVNWTGYGNLLVTSEPDDILTTWSVASKDHAYSAPCSITAYAIGLKSSIPNWGSFLFSVVSAQQNANSSSYLTVSANVEADKVLTCIGASSGYSGYGRLLYAMYPQFSIRSVTASSKDHLNTDVANASLRIRGIQIRKN